MPHVSSARASIVLASFLAFFASPAAAYIGPGAGLGAFAVILALGAGFLLLIVGLVWFPLKRMLNRKKVSSAKDELPKQE